MDFQHTAAYQIVQIFFVIFLVHYIFHIQQIHIHKPFYLWRNIKIFSYQMYVLFYLHYLSLLNSRFVSQLHLQNKKPTNLFLSQVHWLCIFASGSFTIFNFIIFLVLLYKQIFPLKSPSFYHQMIEISSSASIDLLLLYIQFYQHQFISQLYNSPFISLLAALELP